MARVPNVRVNVPVRFPSQVIGSGPITLIKQNGVWRVGIDYTIITNLTPDSSNFANSYLLYYDAVTKAYYTMTLNDIVASVSSGAVQIKTDAGDAAVDAGTTTLILNKAAPSATQVFLPPVADRRGVPLEIYDFGGNAGDITIIPSAGEKIMGAVNPWIVGSGGVPGSGGKTRMVPNTDIGGWCAF